MRFLNSTRQKLTGSLVVALVATALASTSTAQAAQPDDAPTLSWKQCADAEAYECTTARVPRDYAQPAAGHFDLAVVRLPAKDQKHRIGSLFVNFGGPGGTGVQTLKSNGERLFSRLNERYDIVSFDPRGVGESTPAVDCAVNQETSGPFGQPFMTPLDVDAKSLVAADRAYVRRCQERNPGVLPYVSTANVARDLDGLRRAVGDRKLSYVGLSYGTYLGTTYASLFPHSSRALVLEGVLDPDLYANDPLALRASTAAAQERATGRFLQACAASAEACGGFGGADPGASLDSLIARLDAKPLRVGGRRLDGDDVRVALGYGLHSRSTWQQLGEGLVAASKGDGSALRKFADGFYGRREDGTYRASLDQFFAIGAADGRSPHGVRTYLRAGEASWNQFDHAYFMSGYGENVWGEYPVRPRDAFRGPFRGPVGMTALVVGTTYDPATPYQAARKLTKTLGSARLLTLEGDGHGAYGGESRCIDDAVDRYLLHGKLPDEGTRCVQDQP